MVIFVSDMFVENYVGGAELTTEAIIKGGLMPVIKAHSSSINVEIMKRNKDKFWIFGNFANLNEKCILYAVKNLSYSVLEYDYKYCFYRSPEKHISESGHCNCENTTRAKLISVFYRKAVTTWFMSEVQKQKYVSKFSFLDAENIKVLSSVFSRETIDLIESLDISKKNNKWLILNSPSWIKGVDSTIDYAKKNDLSYELVWGLKHKDLLKKMATSKGIIYLPPGGDTCPRFIIEARMLGCDLIINENVQHKNEPWFENRETTIEYLKQRTKLFWSEVENKWDIETPKRKDTANHKFNIIVPFYNAGPWIKKCIESVKEQAYQNFNCFLIDDMSTDDANKIIEKEIKDDKRFKLIINENKQYALGNIVKTLIENGRDDENVNVILDGDDWFSSYNVLSHLDDVYTNSKCLMTYGSYVYHPGGTKGVEPSDYPVDIVSGNKFRQDRWRASHLRTFKTKLWKNIDLEDLKDDDGQYYKTAYDQALMLPLLEMAGEKSKYISEILHVYNRENPLNVDKVKQKIQFETAQKIRSKKPYKRKF